MQANLFTWSDEEQRLHHLCRYNQEVFRKLNKTGKKEFGLQTDGQDFRIMAAVLTVIGQDFFVCFGTSSGQLILERVDFSDGRTQMRQT